MKLNSLAARLVLLACFSLTIALGSIGFVLSAQFNRYFEDRIYAELAAHLDQLTANLSFDENGGLVVIPLLDPRFETPFSGLYWQVKKEGQATVVSRSLWTGTLDIPPSETAGVLARSAFESPTGQPLLGLSRSVLVGQEAAPGLVQLSVAIDQSEVKKAAEGFQATMLFWMAIIFAGLILAAWVQVKLGLAPLETLRQRVERVRSGLDERLDGAFPREVRPLANEVNELLDLHDKTVRQARERAGDLAHGLKTPLAVMNTIARDLRQSGQGNTAAEIEQQIDSMSHFIGRELARVRVRPVRGGGILAKPVAQKMLAAIKRFPRAAELEWELDMPDDFSTPFDAHDLSELLGNLLDNARKWAKSKVRLTGVVCVDGTHMLMVEDDGEGASAKDRAALGQRGKRLDPSTQGNGLGLAICADLATHCGAEFTIERSKIGGLAVCLHWAPAQ